MIIIKGVITPMVLSERSRGDNPPGYLVRGDDTLGGDNPPGYLVQLQFGPSKWYKYMYMMYLKIWKN